MKLLYVNRASAWEAMYATSSYRPTCKHHHKLPEVLKTVQFMLLPLSYKIEQLFELQKSLGFIEVVKRMGVLTRFNTSCPQL